MQTYFNYLFILISSLVPPGRKPSVLVSKADALAEAQRLREEAERKGVALNDATERARYIPAIFIAFTSSLEFVFKSRKDDSIF